MKDDKVYLQHIRDCIRYIIEYTEPGRESFFQSRQMQDAVIRNLEIIGEAVKNLSRELRDRHPDVPWKRIAGMRDEMIHDYMGLDINIVWNVIENHLPTLRQKIDSLLSHPE